MTTPLAFADIEFMGCETIEQDSKNKNQYTVHRKAGSDFRFKATLNWTPEPRTEDDGWCYQPYPGHSLEYHESGAEYKSFWSVDTWASVRCPPGESTVYISAGSAGVRVTVITAELAEEERRICTHPSTRTSEGECWGGGSGSCTVEILTSCVVCGATLDRSFDHRD
jgi:hypothetical protein